MAKPLTYNVHPLLMDTPYVKELARKGHTILRGDCLVDVVSIGPSCYRIVPETVKLLDLVTKAERASKYGASK